MRRALYSCATTTAPLQHLARPPAMTVPKVLGYLYRTSTLRQAKGRSLILVSQVFLRPLCSENVGAKKKQLRSIASLFRTKKLAAIHQPRSLSMKLDKNEKKEGRR